MFKFIQKYYEQKIIKDSYDRELKQLCELKKEIKKAKSICALTPILANCSIIKFRNMGYALNKHDEKSKFYVIKSRAVNKVNGQIAKLVSKKYGLDYK